MFINLVFSIILILISSNSFAESFKYNTTYWFNDIELVCKDSTDMCKLWVNKEYKGESPYTIDGRTAYTTYDRYEVALNLDNGNFNWRTK